MEIVKGSFYERMLHSFSIILSIQLHVYNCDYFLIIQLFMFIYFVYSGPTNE